MIDFFYREKFIAICDIKYDCSQYEYIRNGNSCNIELPVSGNIVIAVRQDLVTELIEKIKLVPLQKFILVVCDSDGWIGDLTDNNVKYTQNGEPTNNPRPRMFYPFQPYDLVWKDIPENIVKVFGQNVCVKDDRLVPIPIGLEDPKYFPYLKKMKTIDKVMKANIPVTKLLYCNVNPLTNVYQRTNAINAVTKINSDDVTIKNVGNGVDFNSYIINIASHKFVICPDGNGCDSHRIWETLYMRNIPIVIRHTFLEEFAKYLPILIVDNWNEITEEFLNEQYEIFSKRTYNYDLLNFSYWEDKLNHTISELLC